MNIEGYSSKFEFEYIIRSSKIQASFNIPNQFTVYVNPTL